MSYDAYNLSYIEEALPDGSTESPNILDDALRETKRCIKRAGIHRYTSFTAASVQGYTYHGCVGLDTTSNDVTYTLHYVIGYPKLQIITWEAGSNTAKVSPYGSDTINGSASDITFTALGETYVLFSDGVSDWKIVSRYYTGIEAVEDSVLVVSHTSASNTYTPTSYTGARFFSLWNTVDKNSISGASISTDDETNDTINLPQGTYTISGWSLMATNAGTNAIEKTSPSYEARVVYGSTFKSTTGDTKDTRAFPITGFLTIDAGGESIRLANYHSESSTTPGGNFTYHPLSAESDFVYANLVIRKLA